MIYTLFIVVSVVRAFPNGVPSLACNSMVPGHGLRPQSNENSQIVFEAEPNLVHAPLRKDEPMENRKKNGPHVVTLTLRSTDGVPFKGFFVQAQSENVDGSFGQFLIHQGPGHYGNCGNGKRTSVTHADNNRKEKILLKWISPSNFTGEVKFKATVVRDFSHFWVDLPSNPVTVED
ncbi:putative defense protein 3 isoform X2 [Artemia franciscana]|uniref:putative defense protein 3 isoform X2 n=1 Tax=Artemia franciscana TaxID=6661 RepID=UPI0032DB5384